MSYHHDVWVPRSCSPIEALLQPWFQAGRQLQVFLVLPIHAVPRVVYDQKLVRAVVLFNEGAQVVVYLVLWLARYVEFDSLRYEAESVLEDGLQLFRLSLCQARQEGHVELCALPLRPS
jgi:hypothetical protein